MALTKRQREILDYLGGFIDDHGYSPSYDEIARHFRLRSLATVHEHLTNLARKGYLRKEYNRSRSLEPTPPARTTAGPVRLPLLGLVAAGAPIEAVVDRETVSIPADMIRRGHNYVLRVQGDSMIDEQIRDGDLLVVNTRESAENGEVVIALVGGDSATVKKFFREGHRIRLQPANERLAPMYFDEREVQVQGVVVGVIRRY
ncbi:MAG: transcriptional repressor LexA [Longimicrobiaceae bacterium]